MSYGKNLRNLHKKLLITGLIIVAIYGIIKLIEYIFKYESLISLYYTYFANRLMKPYPC
jgi:hypothetical protein